MNVEYDLFGELSSRSEVRLGQDKQTQGMEANDSGQYLEGIVLSLFVGRGFLLVHPERLVTPDMFAHRTIARQFPYRSIYEEEARVDFMVAEGDRRLAIECKYQEMQGSVDEKLEFTIRNACERMPAQEVAIVLGGNGARDGAVRRMQSEAKKAMGRKRKIHIMRTDEFRAWVRTEFRR